MIMALYLVKYLLLREKDYGFNAARVNLRSPNPHLKIFPESLHLNGLTFLAKR